MDINWRKGKKCEGDRVLLVTTEQKEPITIYKLAILANQLGINELTIRKAKNYDWLLYEEAMENIFQLSSAGIDLAEEKNLPIVLNWCKRYHLKFELIEPQLRKIAQKKLEFKDGST